MVLPQLSHLLRRLRQRGDLPAQPAAELVAPLQQLNIRSVGRNTPHLCDRMSRRRIDADNEAAGQGKHLWLEPVRRQQPKDRLLHAVDLRAAEYQFISQFRAQVEQGVIIHSIRLPESGYHVSAK